MDSKWGGSSGYSSHHRQSLRPSGVTASAGLASRYGLSSSSSSSPSSSRNGSSSGAASTGSASTGGVGSQLSSSVVSFMRKFVSKASNSNSIDNSFQQYKELQQQQQSSGSKGGSHGASGGKGGGSSAPPTGTASTSSVFAPCGPAAAAGATSSSSTSGNVPATVASSSLGALPSHHSDTGYSSITNSPATTPTVSSISASPIPPAQLISSSSFASDGQSGSRPSSAASTTGGSSATSATSRGPLFSKIRAKMVSTFQATNTGECSNAANVAQPVQPTAAPAAFLAQQSSNTSSSSQSGSNPIQRPESSASLGTGSGTDAQSIASSRQQRSSSITSTSGTVAPMGGSTSPVAGTEASAQRPPMLSMLSQSHSSSLTNEQLTAHLTEEEKKILEKVFQKEEEFREIALKNFVKNTSLGEGATGVGTSGQPTATMLLTGSPVSGVSHLSANMLDPVAAAVHRRRSSAIISSDASGQCRICRKIIMRDESAHRCSNCQELVCDDCSSYSAREESKYWMCSFCRRRGSHLIITTVGTDTTCTSTTSTASAQTSSTFPSHSASSHHHRSSFSALSGVAAAAVSGGSSNPNNTNSSISISVSKSPEPSFSPPAHRSHSTSSSVTAPVSQPQMSQLLSTAASSSSSSSPSSHPPINTFTSTSATTPMFSTSSTLQPGTVAKRKSSFSECQMRPHGHEAITSQRQSSLDLQKSAILLQQHQRKSAQFSQSPLLYEQQQQQQQTSTQQQIAQSWGQIEQQPSKIPRVELPPSQPQMGDAHPLSYFSTTSGANLSSVIGGISAQPALSQPGQISSQFSSSSQLIQPQPSSNITSPSLTTSTTTPTTVALSPQNGTSRPRIYSLSDDEELLSDDDDDDDDEEDDDEEFEDDVAENDEEEEELFEDDAEEFGEEFARRLTQQRKIHRKKVLKETILDDAVLLSECKKRPTNANGRHKTRKGVLSPHKDDSYIHMIGGPSHGTLASVPAETLKRRRSSKRKKKKSPHAGQSYNSDDELMTSSVAKQSEDNAANLPSGATHFVGRRESGAGLSVPMGQNLSTFADVVNTVTGNSLLHRASISEFPLSQGSVSGLGMQRPLSSALYGPGKPLTALQMAYKPNQAIASKWWRLSKKVGSMNRSGGLINVHDNSIFGYGSGLRQRKSSESSDVSDVRYSPTQDSLTPSSEYSRSPRESADSEMLGLTYSSLAMQRRSIPSVLVDVGADSSGLATGHFLTLKDCYNRRGSAGRALPQIPVEPSRSMLDLPHSRKSSAHSLDIPMEQPRRASAPEGENIRIVIDEVQDVTGSHQELLISGAGGVVQDSNYARSASAGSGRRSSGAIVPQTTVVTQVQVAPQGQTSYQQRMRYQLTRAASIVTHYERIILHRDEQDHSNRTRGFGLAVVGGRLNDQDGMLYAYVNWTKPGGPADKQGLKPGDKILEWCTKSLVNCSYEQVCHIMDSCGESAELIVESMVKCDPNQHKRRQSLAAAQQQTSSEQASTSQSPSQQPKIAINAPASSTTNTSAVDCNVARPSSAAAALLPSTSSIPPPITAPAATSQVQPQAASDRGSASSTPRRRLPAIPTTPKSTASTAALLNDAQILLQVTLDASIRQLSVVIVSSRGLEQHPLYNKAPKTANVPDNEAFAQLRLLPEMGFKVCQTELNANFEWNETLIYHQFPLERVDEITLEVSVWSTTANSVSPYYQQAPAQLAPPANQIRLRSPRNSAVGLPPQISVSSSEHSSTFQLASTRIPLRSALFVLSEWWPLIPTEVNYVQAPLDLSTGKSSGGGNGSSMSVPSPAPNLPSTAPPVFFHKVPSMDYIADVSSGNLLCESIMMSRSTPGSRRNSGRSDAGMEMIVEASPCVEEAPDEELVGVGVFSAASDNTASAVQQPPPKRPTTASSMYRPPTRGSTATLNSSGGRHSLDDSSYSNSMGPKSTGDGGSLALDRTTSLRLIQNRHSVGNLYHLPAGVASDAQAAATLASSYIRGAHLAAPYQEQYERRKSSSALGQDTSGKSVVGTSSTAPGGAQPLFAGGGYSRFTGTRQDDSCQYLLQSQNLGQPSISDQDTSPFSSDDDIDNLLLDDSNFNSDQNTPVRPTTTFPNFRPQSSASMMGGCPSTTVAQAAEILSQPSKKLSDTKLNQLTVVDTNKLSIASIDDPSRYSGTASPVTPSNEEEPEDASGSVGSQQNLLAPNWAVGRRKSFLQRMIPTAVAAGASLLLNRPDEGTLAAEPPKSVVVGEIKLGFIMTKGLFEIEVVAARGLPDSVMGPFPPDTYVKTYVHDKGRQLHKRKTRVIPADKNPQYRQTLKYDANILFDRTLLVSVWEKQKRTFDSNVPIGAMEINVNQLELHKLTIRWYKLRSFVTGTESLPIAPVLTNEPSTSDPTTDRAEQ